MSTGTRSIYNLFAAQLIDTEIPGAKKPEIAESAMRAYVTDLETMRLISTAHQLTVRLPKESPIGSFTVWHDGRSALGQFVRHLSGP